MGCRALWGILETKSPEAVRAVERHVSPFLQGLHWLIPSLITDEGSAKAQAYVESLCPEQEKHLVRRVIKGRVSREDVCSWVDQRGIAISLIQEHKETVKSILTFLDVDQEQQEKELASFGAKEGIRKGIQEGIQEGITESSDCLSLAESLIQGLVREVSPESLEILRSLTLGILGKDDKVETLFAILKRQVSESCVPRGHREGESIIKTARRGLWLLSQHSWTTRLHIVACGLCCCILSLRGVHRVIRNTVSRWLIHHLDVLVKRSLVREPSQEEKQKGGKWLRGVIHLACQALEEGWSQSCSFSSQGEFDSFLQVNGFKLETLHKKLEEHDFSERRETLWEISTARNDLLPGAIEIKSRGKHVLLAPQGRGLSLLMPHEGPLIEYCMRSMGQNRRGTLLDQFLGSCWIGTPGIHCYRVLNEGADGARSEQIDGMDEFDQEYLLVSNFLKNPTSSNGSYGFVPTRFVPTLGRYKPLIAGSILLKGGSEEKPNKEWLFQGLQSLGGTSNNGPEEDMWLSAAHIRVAIMAQEWGLEERHQEQVCQYLRRHVETMQQGASWIQYLPEGFHRVLKSFFNGIVKDLEQRFNSLTNELFPGQGVNDGLGDLLNLLIKGFFCVSNLVTSEVEEIFEQVTSCEARAPIKGSLRHDVNILLKEVGPELIFSALKHQLLDESKWERDAWQDSLSYLADGIRLTSNLNVRVTKNFCSLLCAHQDRDIQELHDLVDQWKKTTASPPPPSGTPSGGPSENLFRNHLTGIALVAINGHCLQSSLSPHPYGSAEIEVSPFFCNLTSISRTLLDTMPGNYISLREKGLLDLVGHIFQVMNKLLPARKEYVEASKECFEACSRVEESCALTLKTDSCPFLPKTSAEIGHVRDKWLVPVLLSVSTNQELSKTIFKALVTWNDMEDTALSRDRLFSILNTNCVCQEFVQLPVEEVRDSAGFIRFIPKDWIPSILEGAFGLWKVFE